AKTDEAAGALALPGGYNYGDDAGSGWENTGTEDFTIPFLAILQTNSPQCSEDEAEHIEGAKAGMLINTATQELYDGKTGVELVPCYTQHLFVEWRNRQTDGGGFIGIHAADSEVVAKAKAASTQFGKYIVPVDDGIDHDLVETFYIYGMIVAGEELIGPCMVSFSSTKIKAYKNIMTPLRQVKGRPPLFAFKLKINTVAEKNAKGSFHNFKIAPAGGSAVASLIAPVHPFFLAGKEFKDQVAEGKAKIDHGGGNTGDGDGTAEPAPF
ncbi:hypothetical protein KAR91_40450, partial [Candidatus Pacearchaeota archaeon]|nr:hypothetical protein [Candidatus Pacearchaeota archaeon]